MNKRLCEIILLGCLLCGSLPAQITGKDQANQAKPVAVAPAKGSDGTTARIAQLEKQIAALKADLDVWKGIIMKQQQFTGEMLHPSGYFDLATPGKFLKT